MANRKVSHLLYLKYLFVIFFVNTYVLVVIFYEKINVLLIVISKIKNVKSCYLNVSVWGLIHQINEEK